ncbi:hypothetical protein FVE85_8345 [Porphyridium purpureum]|uniref:Ribosomal RNA-processing protein 7 C-terminal domain-containing protein n=1 Tax=Porphyridium purpureum TaxID=35688 RepID=A0A5J4YMG7_PORPP|nr:hypothetical protein FVE85_8345 [Porphyridium purpureum]|eukprot:POR1548..scf244_11
MAPTGLGSNSGSTESLSLAHSLLAPEEGYGSDSGSASGSGSGSGVKVAPGAAAVDETPLNVQAYRRIRVVRVGARADANTAKWCLYLCEGGDQLSILVANLPIVVSEAAIKVALQHYVPVASVSIVPARGEVNEVATTQSALVRFDSTSACKKLFTLGNVDHLARLLDDNERLGSARSGNLDDDTGEENRESAAAAQGVGVLAPWLQVSARGPENWLLTRVEKKPDLQWSPDQLKFWADRQAASYDDRMEQQRLARERQRGVVDADGFIMVMDRSKSKKSAASEAARIAGQTQPTAESFEKRKKPSRAKLAAADDFYGLKHKTGKRRRLADLQDEFKRDAEKVNIAKQTRQRR